MHKIALIILSLALLAPGMVSAKDKTAKDDDFDPSKAAKTEIYFDMEDESSDWIIGLAPRLGVNIPTSDLGAFFLAAISLDVLPPVLNHQLVLAFDFSFSRPGHDGSGTDPRLGNPGDYTFEVNVLELKMGLDVIYRFFDAKHRLVPFAGAGFITQYQRTTQTTSIDSEENTEWNFAPGFEVLGGVDFTLGPGNIFADVRYTFALLDHRFTGDTNAANITLAAGYRYFF